MKFYVNGFLTNTISNSIGLTCNENLRILASRYAYENNQNVNNMKVYNFMAYNRELTETEIQKNFNTDKEKYGI